MQAEICGSNDGKVRFESVCQCSGLFHLMPVLWATL